MKKVFSLLLVVAMLVSMAVVASAASPNASGGMHTVITETDSGITVTVYVANVVDCSGFTFNLQTSAIAYNGNLVVNPAFNSPMTTPTPTSMKMVYGMTSSDNWFTDAGSVEILSFDAVKTNPDYELSESDFAYGTSLSTQSKITTAPNQTVAGQAAGASSFKSSSTLMQYFTIAYVDERTSAPVDEFVNDTSSAVEGTTITCAGRVGAEHLSKKYGVEFTADSTVGGSRPQVFYGAKPGDIVSDGAGGTKTFVFDGWDGTFEIILQGVHTGTKSFRFFVGSDYTDLSSKVVSE